MADKKLEYTKKGNPTTLWNKVGPFVKLREYLAKNITPDVYADEQGLKTKVMEFFGQDVPKANVDDFSQNLWLRFLNQPNNLKEENGIVRLPDNIKSIISDRINGGWDKMAKKYGSELNSINKKIIDANAAGKDASGLEEKRTVIQKKLNMVEEGLDLLQKARTGKHQVFNEYNFMPDAYGDLNDLSGLSSFTMYRDDRGRMVVKDKYDFYSSDQPLDVGIVTKTLDAIGYPFEIQDYIEDKNPNVGDTADRILLRAAVNSKNNLDKKMEIKSKKQDGGSSRPEIDWNRFKSEYENMERVGKGTHRVMDVEGLNMIYEALYDKGFNQRQIEAVLGNIIEESGGNPYAVADSGGYKGLFQESDKRYPPQEFEKDKKRFKDDKKGYINYMIDRFYDHIQDAGKYSIKGTKYNRAIHAVNEFMSDDPGTDYSYPLVYAFEAPSDKKGTYQNRKKVSDLISQSYISDVSGGIDDQKENKTLVDYVLGLKNDLELQNPLVTSKDEAFREARRKGLSEFIWNGKKYNTKMKADGGPTYEYIASKDNTSIGKPGINENVSHAVKPNEGIDITEVIAGGIPGVGDVMDVVDLKKSIEDGDDLGVILSLAGMVPVVGGLATPYRRIIKDRRKFISELKESLGQLPDYAKPNSPISKSWINHRSRLVGGNFKKKTGFDPVIGFDEDDIFDPHMFPDKDFNIYDMNDDVSMEMLANKLGYKYDSAFKDKIKNMKKEHSSMFVMHDRGESSILEGDWDESYDHNPAFRTKDGREAAYSHEIDHVVGYPLSSPFDNNGFSFDNMSDKVKDYFGRNNGTEISARGSQIKDYFGLTSPKQEVTESMLKYAKDHYIDDYGINNNMDVFFNSISDYKKAAKWISENASVGLGLYMLPKFIKEEDEKIKREGGDVWKDITIDDFRIGGSVQDKQRQAYTYFTEKRGMSQIQALAIIGNLMAESGMQETTRGDDDTSYGIQQWHKERKTKLFDYAKKKGHSEPSFQDQLEFLADEYEGKTGYSNFLYQSRGKKGPGYYNYSRQDFQNAPGLYDAVVAWNQGAGRPHKSVIRNDVRYEQALKAAKNIGIDVEDQAPTYGQMGFDNSLIEATGVQTPETVQQDLISQGEVISEQDMQQQFQSWVDTYGKDIAAHITSIIGSKDKGSQSVDDQQRQYRQLMQESEEEKRRKLISQVLPSIQLKIKGVTQVDGAARDRS